MNIGIILNSLETAQLSYETISSINNEILNKSKHSYRIFFEDLSTQVLSPMCATMNLAEIWHYQGILISTSLDNTLFSLKVAGNLMRIFYIWDMEWLRNNKNYISNISILRDPNLYLIARNQECAFELYRYCNRQPNLIMPRLNFSELINTLKL